MDNWKSNRLVFNTAAIGLEAGKSYNVKIEYFFDGGMPLVKFGWEMPNHDTVAEAVKLAKESDAVVIFAGLSDRFECESFDRRRLELPNQDVLIRAVAKVNPRTIVVLNTGGPVLMKPWLKDAAAIVQAWYPGQEGGNAIADILLGNTNPSAKLPVSFIKSPDDSPAFKDYKDRSLKSPYPEGIFVGYRRLDKQGIHPLFPFGHGLSYTRFEYSNLRIDPVGEYEYAVSMDIKNSGKMKGAEVVQLYVKDVECRVERPEKELKGFSKVFLKPGEKKTVTIKLKKESFAFYDTNREQWVVEPGEFEIWLGRSSGDIRLKDRVLMKFP
jgi:beta-glucosidase